MNLFFDYNKKISSFLENLEKKNILKSSGAISSLTVELPPKGLKGDLSCNAAMILAKLNKKSPFDIAEILREKILESFNEIDQIEIAKPGFLNIFFKNEFRKKLLLNIIELNSTFGSSKRKRKNYNIEFVSANPTGPLHVGHCRGAIIGDVLSNLLKFNGHNVTKEYYVNDYGGQIKIFVLSIYYRIIEILEKKKFPNDLNLYPGDYIITIAKQIVKENEISDFKDYNKIYEKLKNISLKLSMKLIKSNLKILGIEHDHFVYESDLIKNNLVPMTIDKLKKDGYVYLGELNPPKGELTKEWKSRKQLLFNSTKFGDDTDRALQKIDGTWTYFASDIAYHENKINRNFDTLINILGADHAGYINRITSAVKALSQNKMNLVCKVSQLVKLYKNNKPFKMSKRKGDYIVVDDLVNEVGKDSVRFMMLNRSNDVELDFDFEKVTEKSKENPVFYVQYAYARINSIFKILKLNLSDEFKLNDDTFKFNQYEIEILKKISEWPKCIETSYTKLEPHRIPFYLYDLVTLFHSYWSLGKENREFRFIQENLKFNSNRIALIKALSIVINNGLSILGVSSPKSM